MSVSWSFLRAINIRCILLQMKVNNFRCIRVIFLINYKQQKGADEVLRLLLDKGVAVDLLDENRENALDIAIRLEHRECIRVLLEHHHWTSLFLPAKNSSKNRVFQANLNYIPNENRQMVALFEKKMWNEFEIILNRSVDTQFKGIYIYSLLIISIVVSALWPINHFFFLLKQEHEYNFTVLDPIRFKKMKKHPLMLITKSGQEKLLMHEITRILLQLKWRFLPRLVFYANILIHLMFIVLFVSYSTEIIEVFHTNACIRYRLPLILLSSVLVFKNVIQIFLMDGLGFFFTLGK